MKYLLTLLLVIGVVAPVYAVDPYKGVDEEVKEAKAFVAKLKASPLSADEKFFGLSENFVGEVRNRKVAENFIDWYMAGVGRALDATPLKVRDSLPPGMENADIPEYLVHQLLNMDAMSRAQDEVVGAPKKPPVLYLGIKLTQEEVRRLSNSDDMINFVINHEDRVFYQVQK